MSWMISSPIWATSIAPEVAKAEVTKYFQGLNWFMDNNSVKNNPRQPRFRIKWASWRDESNGMRLYQFRTYSSPVQQLQVEKVEFSTLFESFLGHIVSFWGLLGVILGLKMSVLRKRIEWYAFTSIWNLFKPSRAVTSWKSWILNTSRGFFGSVCVFVGSFGGHIGS